MVPPDRPQMTIQYGACALHSGRIRLQTQTKKTQKLLLFDGNNGYANACYIYFIMPTLLGLLYSKICASHVTGNRNPDTRPHENSLLFLVHDNLLPQYTNGYLLIVVIQVYLNVLTLTARNWKINCSLTLQYTCHKRSSIP